MLPEMCPPHPQTGQNNTQKHLLHCCNHDVVWVLVWAKTPSLWRQFLKLMTILSLWLPAARSYFCSSTESIQQQNLCCNDPKSHCGWSDCANEIVHEHLVLLYRSSAMHLLWCNANKHKANRFPGWEHFKRRSLSSLLYVSCRWLALYSSNRCLCLHLLWWSSDMWSR